MTKILLIIASICSLAIATIDCRDLKEGTFKLESPEGNYTIIRSKNKQVEQVDRTGLRSEFKLRWTSDCSYILFDRKVLQGVDNIISDEEAKDTLFCKIVNVSGKKHTVSCYIKGYEPLEATLERVKEVR